MENRNYLPSRERSLSPQGVMKIKNPARYRCLLIAPGLGPAMLKRKRKTEASRCSWHSRNPSWAWLLGIRRNYKGRNLGQHHSLPRPVPVATQRRYQCGGRRGCALRGPPTRVRAWAPPPARPGPRSGAALPTQAHSQWQQTTTAAGPSWGSSPDVSYLSPPPLGARAVGLASRSHFRASLGSSEVSASLWCAGFSSTIACTGASRSLHEPPRRVQPMCFNLGGALSGPVYCGTYLQFLFLDFHFHLYVPPTLFNSAC